jgi:hypothetical protein
VVKKWLEEQSWKTQYVCLNLPEPLKLGSREEVEKHFRQTHLSNIITPVETSRLDGTAARLLRSPALLRLLRQAWEDQRRFPLQIATVLSQQFAGHGLQFFKVNRTVTHVAVARPHYLDLEATPVSEGIKRIVNFINATPKCTRRRLFEALAPGAALPEQASPTGSTEPSEPSPEQTAVISDLHWLVHQGHVIEFANGLLEMAKKPLAKPAKPPAAATPAEATPGEQTETGAPTTNDLMPPPAALGEPESLAVAPGELAATAGPIQPESATDKTEEAPPAESR